MPALLWLTILFLLLAGCEQTADLPLPTAPTPTTAATTPPATVRTPRISLEIDAPEEMRVGESAEIDAIAVVDNGFAEVEVPLSRLTTLIPGSSTYIEWSTNTPSIIGVNGSVIDDDAALVRALAAGEAIVRVAIAGLTAEERITVLAAPLISIPPPAMPTPNPPASTTPDALNGSYGFGDLRRGASDCGLVLREQLSGTFSVEGVPAAGAGGRARLNYGTIYDWLQLSVVLASVDVLDFESEAIAAPIPGYQVFVSGRFLVRERSGTLRFIWVQLGQPRSNACAVFEGPIRRP